MTASKRRRLREWLLRRLLTESGLRFELWHQGRSTEAKVCDLQGDQGSAEDRSSQIERHCFDEAAEHAEAFVGRQQYVVRGLKADASAGEHPFWLAPRGQSEMTSALGLPTPEQAHAHAGDMPYVPIDPQRHPGQELSHAVVQLVSQAQRHNEALMRQLVELSTAHAERDNEIIRSQQNQLDRYERARLERHELTEELLSRKLERDLVHQAHEHQEKRKDRLMRKLEDVVFPAILRSPTLRALLGDGKAAANDGDPVVERLKKLFLKLPESTQSQVIAELGDEDGHALLDIFASGHVERQEEIKH